MEGCGISITLENTNLRLFFKEVVKPKMTLMNVYSEAEAALIFVAAAIPMAMHN